MSDRYLFFFAGKRSLDRVATRPKEPQLARLYLTKREKKQRSHHGGNLACPSNWLCPFSLVCICQLLGHPVVMDKKTTFCRTHTHRHAIRVELIRPGDNARRSLESHSMRNFAHVSVATLFSDDVIEHSKHEEKNLRGMFNCSSDEERVIHSY